MRRLPASLILGYILVALVSKAREAAGVMRCGCDDDCWCRRPGLSLFRWVFPWGHHNAGVEAWKVSAS